jgi:hypothetical protein
MISFQTHFQLAHIQTHKAILSTHTTGPIYFIYFATEKKKIHYLHHKAIKIWLIESGEINPTLVGRTLHMCRK